MNASAAYMWPLRFDPYIQRDDQMIHNLKAICVDDAVFAMLNRQEARLNSQTKRLRFKDGEKERERRTDAKRDRSAIEL